MSWDVLLIRIPPELISSLTLPSDFKSELGPRAEVISLLSKICPEASFADPDWGVLDGDGFSIEFDMGREDSVDTILLHIHGSGKAVEVIQKVCQMTGWSAMDIAHSDFIDFSRRLAKDLSFSERNTNGTVETKS